MPQITLAEQNWYRANIAFQANTAQTLVENRVRNVIENQVSTGQKIDIAEIRNQTIDIVSSAANVYGNNAKAISNQFFDYTMQVQNNNNKAKIFEYEWNEEWIDEQIRYLVQLAIDGKMEEYLQKVGHYSNFLIWKSGFDNSWKNARYYGMRWARVPSGNKTCAWCYMLASRGFVYHSEESAGGGFFSYHDRCDCEVIAQSDKGKLDIENYDIEQLRGIYKEARNNALEGFDYKQGGKALEGRVLEELRKIITDKSRNV